MNIYNTKNSRFNCSDEVIRTMEEIGRLTEKGIKTNIICKTKNKEYSRWQELQRGHTKRDTDRLRFPKKLTGSKQWCE